ncbi:MAG: Crp/Fnr family transcriptional regulator [Anaerolineales bacterium]
MISPETLKRFPFFASLNDEQLKQIAMIGDEVEFNKEQLVAVEGQPADALYVLTEGSADLYFTIQDDKTNTKREFLVGEITAGDPFGITALLEPYKHLSSVRCTSACKAICINAPKLRELAENDPTLATIMLKHIALAALERLDHTRVQLAAAWA